MKQGTLKQFLRRMIDEAERVAPRDWAMGSDMRMRLFIERIDGSHLWLPVQDEAYASQEHKSIWCALVLPALLVRECAVRYGVMAEAWGLSQSAAAGYDEWRACGHGTMAIHPARFEQVALMAFESAGGIVATNRIKRVGKRQKRRLTGWRIAAEGEVGGSYSNGAVYLLPADLGLTD